MRLGLALLLLAVSAGAAADQHSLLPPQTRSQLPAPPVPPPAKPCSTPEYRQFDFWVGRWLVKNAEGTAVLGHNTIVPLFGACALHENWVGAKGFHGESFNIYDADERRWHQSWIDQSGGLLLLDGGLQGNAMVLQGQHHKDGQLITERITWTPLPDGRVHQLWETLTEGGSWSVAFDGYYQHY